MSTTRRAEIISSFKDAGTGQSYTAGAVVPIEAGPFANYATAGLVREAKATSKSKATSKPKRPRKRARPALAPTPAPAVPADPSHEPELGSSSAAD